MLRKPPPHLLTHCYNFAMVQGMEALCGVLSNSNNTLTELDIGENNIGPSGETHHDHDHDHTCRLGIGITLAL